MEVAHLKTKRGNKMVFNVHKMMFPFFLKKAPLMIECNFFMNFTVQKRQALIPFPRTGKRASIQPHKYQDDVLGQKLVAAGIS